MVLLDNEAANPELEGLQRSYAIELTYRYQWRKTLGLALPIRLGNMDVGAFTNPGFLSADLLLHYAPLGGGRTVSPYLRLGYGLVKETDRATYTQFPVSLGTDLRVRDNVTLSLRAEYRSTDVSQRNNVNFAFGYVYRFTGADSDGDRVPNGRDACPNVPGVSSAAGCPDGDGDGIRDREDQCPDAAGPATTGGCPDYDGDGVPDSRDQCPYEAGKKRLRGCPDIDNDGVPDDIDGCPNTPGSLYTGCPDTDGDGFDDPDDDCPTVAGTNRGCPELTPDLREALLTLGNEFRFSGRSPTLSPASLPLLDRLVTLLTDNPGFTLVVATHTDASGSPENNELLTEQRALAIRGYLISKGIASDRVKTQAYGATRPAADNGTGVGRELNNRVDFTLVPR